MGVGCVVGTITEKYVVGLGYCGGFSIADHMVASIFSDSSRQIPRIPEIPVP